MSASSGLAARNLRIVLLVAHLIGLAYLLVDQFVDVGVSSYVPLVFTIVTFVSRYLFHKGYYQYCSMGIVLAILCATFGGVLQSGGLSSPYTIWLMASPVVAAIISDWRTGFVAGVLNIGFVVIEKLYGISQYVPQESLSNGYSDTLNIFIYSSAISTITYFSALAVRNLEKSKKSLEGISRALNQVAIVAKTDSRGRIKEANDYFCKVSQYERSELIGKTHKVVNSKYHSKDFFKGLWGTIKGGRTWRGEIKNRAKDGSTYWVDTSIVPIYSPSGEIREFLAIRFDITNKKRAEELVRKQKEQMISTARLSSLGEVAGGIAHEINNPLTTIALSLSLIKNGLKDDANSKAKEIGRATLGTVDKTVSRISQIVGSLRSISESNDDIKDGKVQLNSLCKEIVRLCSERFHGNGVTLEFVCDPGLSNVLVSCSRVQVAQAVLNLLNNAHDAVRKLEDPWVKLTISIQDSVIDIEVRDCGNGLEPDVEQNIFSPFFTTKGMGKGTGLGLNISRHFIQKNDGHLFYELREGHTCFVIELPLKATLSVPEPESFDVA